MPSIEANKVYGMLTAIHPTTNGKVGHARWEFRCSCGNLKVARSCHVLEGRTVACGCLRVQRVKESNAARTGVKPGDRFGRLVAVSFTSVRKKHAVWSWLCDCGKRVDVSAQKAKSGHTQSCGCYSRESARNRLFTHGFGNKATKEYRAWSGLKQRCLNPRNTSFPDYGARGITVCDRWLGSEGFANFLADMGPAPSPDHSVDRLENSRGYSPDNCAWRTRVEQMNNRRGNVNLTHNGETLSITAWAKRVGLKRATLSARLRIGWSVHDALTVQIKTLRQVRRKD